MAQRGNRCDRIHNLMRQYTDQFIPGKLFVVDHFAGDIVESDDFDLLCLQHRFRSRQGKSDLSPFVIVTVPLFVRRRNFPKGILQFLMDISQLTDMAEGGQSQQIPCRGIAVNDLSFPLPG